MKQFIAFVKKEFRHIIRDNRTLLIILGMPVVEVLLFGFAVNMEVQNIRVAVYDPTPDAFTTGIAERIRQNSYFNYRGSVQTMDEMEESMRKGELDLAVVFQQNFQKELVHSGEADVQLLSNSSDPNRGSIAATYATAIIAGFQREQTDLIQIPFQIQTENRMIYNPLMKSSYMFVPGIMGLVLMIICTIMTGNHDLRKDHSLYGDLFYRLCHYSASELFCAGRACQRQPPVAVFRCYPLHNPNFVIWIDRFHTGRQTGQCGHLLGYHRHDSRAYAIRDDLPGR